MFFKVLCWIIMRYLPRGYKNFPWRGKSKDSVRWRSREGRASPRPEPSYPPTRGGGRRRLDSGWRDLEETDWDLGWARGDCHRRHRRWCVREGRGEGGRDDRAGRRVGGRGEGRPPVPPRWSTPGTGTGWTRTGSASSHPRSSPSERKRILRNLPILNVWNALKSHT